MESDSESEFDDEEGLYDLSPDEDELFLEDDDSEEDELDDIDEDELNDLKGRIEEIEETTYCRPTSKALIPVNHAPKGPNVLVKIPTKLLNLSTLPKSILKDSVNLKRKNSKSKNLNQVKKLQ